MPDWDAPLEPWQRDEGLDRTSRENLRRVIRSFHKGGFRLMSDAQLLSDALRLAAERVTGDDLIAKTAERRDLLEAAARIEGWRKSGPAAPQRPDAQQLRQLLNNPDDRAIREALSRWDSLEWEGTSS